MSTARSMAPHRPEVPVPMSGAQELTAVRINERRCEGRAGRCELFEHNPAVEPVAAEGLAAAAARANGSTPSIRADQSSRYRLMQLDGSRALPYEELVAIGLENDLGADVALEMLRPLFRALADRHPAKVAAFATEISAAAEGEVVERETTDLERFHALALALAELQQRAARDVSDGHIDENLSELIAAVVTAAKPFTASGPAFYRRSR